MGQQSSARNGRSGLAGEGNDAAQAATGLAEAGLAEAGLVELGPWEQPALMSTIESAGRSTARRREPSNRDDGSWAPAGDRLRQVGLVGIARARAALAEAARRAEARTAA